MGDVRENVPGIVDGCGGGFEWILANCAPEVVKQEFGRCSICAQDS